MKTVIETLVQLITVAASASGESSVLTLDSTFTATLVRKRLNYEVSQKEDRGRFVSSFIGPVFR
jgi:hypothetical protein